MILEDWFYGPWRYIEVYRPPGEGSGYYNWSRLYSEGPKRMKAAAVTDRRFDLMEKYWDSFPVVQIWTWDGKNWVVKG